MNPSSQQRVKLSSAMRVAIRKMRMNNPPYRTFYDILNGHWILEGDSFWDSTMKALLKRGIIEAGDKNNHGLQYYHLSELGKTINI